MDSKAASKLFQCGRPAPSVSRTVISFVAAALALYTVAATAQTTPIAIVSDSKMVVTTINGNAGHVAANSAGDAFYDSQTDNTTYWVPRGTTKPIAVVTGLSGGRSVYVDPNNNLFVPSNYGGVIIEVPYVNGTYATGLAAGTVSACSTATPTAPCTQFGSGGSVTSYYYQPTDLGFDTSGNAYVIDEYSNTGPGGPGKSNSILKWTLTKGTYVASYITMGLPQNNSAQIAVGPKGDVYYADGTNVYYVAAGASTATTITTSAMSNPTGVATDIYGDLFITNASTPFAILEMPALNGVAQPSKQFQFSNGYTANGIAFDQLGDYFSTGYSGTTNLNETTLYSFNLGSVAVGKPIAASAQTINLLFTGAAAPATITLTGAGSGFSYVAGTCAGGASYVAGNSCNINVNYTPTASGLQRGSVVLANASGASIATVTLSGIGLGAQQTSDPATISAVGSGFKTPQGIAVDSANNVYIADPGLGKVLEYAAGSTTAVSLGTGLVTPTSIALDGAGNLYIADSGNGRVVEVPNVAGTLTTGSQSVIATGLGTSLGIALDGNANLYIADSTNSQVLKLANIDGVPSAGATSKVALTGAVAPIAVTTDSIGNLFIADTTANTITEVMYYGKAQLNIGTGYSHPSGLTTDAAGSLYIADTGNMRLLKIPYETPIYNTNDQYLVGGTIVAPYGVALDASSNLYATDSANAAAYFLNRSQGTLALGRANLNNPTASQNAYVANSGNQALTLGTPDYAATGSTSVFTITSPASNGCNNGSKIAAGFSCVLSASFDPVAVGNLSELLTFSSNTVNTPVPTLTLTGLGLNLAATTLSLAQTTPTGTASFGQTITVTATIASAKSGTPSGTITFFVDGGNPITVTVSGNTVPVALKGLTGGSHLIAASYTGDNNFAPSNTTLTLTVAQATSSISVAAGGANVFQNPASAQPGTAIVLTAAVGTSATTIPTGTVTFTYGSILLGTAVLTPSGTKYLATSTTSVLTAGIDTVTATYNGDVNYSASSTTLTITVGPMTFSLTPAAISLTLSPAQAGSLTMQVTSLAGFGGTTSYVALNCTGLPANTVCGFSPNGFVLQPNNQITAQQVDVNGNIIVAATYGPTPVVLTVETGTTPVVPQPKVGTLSMPGFLRGVPVGFALLGFAPLTLLLRRRALQRLRGTLCLVAMLFALLGSATMFSGCSSSIVGVTPTGTYNVTITATALATGYSGALAPGCALSASSSTATTPTCTQTSTFTLIVK